MCIVSHIENSKNDKGYITYIILLKQCTVAVNSVINSVIN